jgi:hypothetical protein
MFFVEFSPPTFSNVRLITTDLVPLSLTAKLDATVPGVSHQLGFEFQLEIYRCQLADDPVVA